MKTYYKVVRTDKAKVKLYPITNYGYAVIQADYPVGTWITAPVGGFFAFKTKQAAKSYLNTHHYYTSHPTLSWKVVPCRLKSFVPKPRAYNGQFEYSRSGKKAAFNALKKDALALWEQMTGDAAEIRMGLGFPDGTVCARKMHILETT